EGTNTTNQVWTVIGEGRIVRHQKKPGITTFTVEMAGTFEKKNSKDNTIKIAQQGEGMAAVSNRWGEVAMGVVKSVESGGKVVNIEVSAATKLDTRHKVPAWEEAPQS
ncbi:MAG TPA: hypothetical protein V6D22_20525, partial [Candidatus Obscuribacterales bacterium]